MNKISLWRYKLIRAKTKSSFPPITVKNPEKEMFVRFANLWFTSALFFSIESENVKWDCFLYDVQTWRNRDYMEVHWSWNCPLNQFNHHHSGWTFWFDVDRTHIHKEFLSFFAHISDRWSWVEGSSQPDTTASIFFISVGLGLFLFSSLELFQLLFAAKSRVFSSTQ